MKTCPQCGRTYIDETLLYCTVDGSPLSGLYNAAETLPLYKDERNRQITMTPRRRRLGLFATAATMLILISIIIFLLFVDKKNDNTNRSVSIETAPRAMLTPSPSSTFTPKPTPSNTLSPSSSSTHVATEADHTELEIIDPDGKSTFLSDPSIAYPSGFGPSKLTTGLAVRRGVEESTLEWSRVRMLRFRSRQERTDKGTTVWRHAVDATLANGTVIVVELQDDWNMAYMGGGGTGLLFGRTDLGETKIPFSRISTLKVLKYARPEKKSESAR